MEVWKYTLKPGENAISAPTGAKFLCAGAQRGDVCVWAQVDPEEPRSHIRTLRAYGTGHEMPATATKYIGTAFLDEATFVFHVFELEPEAKP